MPFDCRQLQASRMLDHLATHLVEMQAEPSLVGGKDVNGDASGRAQLMERLRTIRLRLDRLANS